MRKRTKVIYILGTLFVIGFLTFNIYTSMLIFELKGTIEKFYQKDFVDIKIISEQLVRDIEKTYGNKLPSIELNIRLSEYSETGIQYNDNSKILQLFLPPKIIDLDNKQTRAYLAHELGHYILKHIDYPSPRDSPRDITKEIEADLFSLKFSSIEDLSSVIKKLVWDENERTIRLAALNRN